MKAGTTYLYNLLVQHPEICGCIEKEPCFFSEHSNENLNFNEYQSLWKTYDKNFHKFALEASVNYTKIFSFPNSAERISQFSSIANFKFIYIVRNPLDRIKSHLQFMNIYRRKEKTYKGYDFEINKHTLEVTSYYLQISEYFKRFPHSDIKIIFFEDLKENPQRVCNEIFDFLEIRKLEINTQIDKFETKQESFKSWVYKFRLLFPKNIQFKKNLPFFLKKLMIDKKLNDFQLSEQDKDFIIRSLKDDLFLLKNKYSIDINRWNLPIIETSNDPSPNP